MTNQWNEGGYTEIRAKLREILPDTIGLAVCDPRQIQAHGGGLWPQEKPAIAHAVAKRRREFGAGRIMARQAMAAIGLSKASIPMGPDRAPIWPEGVVGSISHCESLCIAVVARSQDIREIGIDVEEYTPLEQNLWAEICIEEEVAWLNTQPHEMRGYIAKRIFSAKEAVYKAVFPRIRQVLEFDAITVDFEQSLASCFLSHKRIVSLWADRGQSPWFSVDLPQQKQPVSESSKGLFAC